MEHFLRFITFFLNSLSTVKLQVRMELSMRTSYIIGEFLKYDGVMVVRLVVIMELSYAIVSGKKISEEMSFRHTSSTVKKRVKRRFYYSGICLTDP